jgi:hypothetical protein
MPNPRKSLLGKWYGQLEVKQYSGKTESGASLWLCYCHACEKFKEMRYTTLTHRTRRVKSCGCDRGRKRTLRPDRQPRNTPDQP